MNGWNKTLVGLCLVFLALPSGTAAVAGEIDYAEDFALAPDRAVPLKQLIPGTEDYYFYHCLHFQNTEQYAQVEQLLQDWIKRHNYTPRVREILNRQALLTYAANPTKSLDYLRQQLNLQFHHQRERLDAKPDLPTALDQKLISRQTLTERAMRQYQNLQGFTDPALDWLVAVELKPELRRHLLQRLQRPDYPNLPKLVVDDLTFPNSGGFGSLAIHKLLLLAQLDECLKLKPDLLNQSEFVNVYLSRLQPDADVNWQHDADAYGAYLDRLWAFAQRLASVHNSLKAHVVYHRLAHDRSQGTYDQDRFLTYLQLPRQVAYIRPEFLDRQDNRRYAANLGADYANATRLPPVGDDEPLVRSYLQHFFIEAPDYKAYEPYVLDTYLKRQFAETKIVNGLGEGEQWYSLLPPAEYQALKERVDLDFAFHNAPLFAADAPVSLDLYVKNVGTLIVKVFEINTRNYYRENLREVNTDINLDGLVANRETTHAYAEPPLRRVRRHFEFPELNKPGVYVVDFIGSGKSSRAVIRKGRLRHLERTTVAGHSFTVMDEQNRKLPAATLWLAGREYAPNDKGQIVVPFSNAPAAQKIVLANGDFCSLDEFVHQSENYALAAGIHVDRESLLARNKAQVVIRPQLYLNGMPVTLSVLEDVRLVITSTDLDGVATAKEVPDFKLFEDRESTFEFQVPQRLAKLDFRLQAKVQNLSQNKKIDLAVGDSFSLNEIDRTEKVEDLHLARFDGQYAVELLGKTGEPRADRPVQFALQHRDFKDPVQVTLQSDAQGRVVLGTLADIVSVTATGPEGTAHTWPLERDEHTYYQTVHGRTGEPIVLPYMGSAQQPQRDELSLLELRGEGFLADRFDALTMDAGLLCMTGLKAGDYDLWLKKSHQHIRLRVTAGEVADGHVLGRDRQLEIRDASPLQISRVEATAEALAIRLSNASKVARVHVFGTRYCPAFAPYGNLAKVGDAEPVWRELDKLDSLYAAGRNLGDEYRYIIDRKYAKKLPGNMLERPSLLLNPWAVRGTETAKQEAKAGEDFAAEAESAARSKGGGGRDGRAAAGRGDFANLDFLDEASVLLLNVVPDEQGLITIDRKDLGSHQHLHIVAVDPRDTVCRSISLPEVPVKFKDLRLARGLDPAKHFAQRKQITAVDAKQPLVLADIASSQFETYDSLACVYTLYATLSNNATLAEFSFVLNWPDLKPEEKREKYSKYACHELNFFLYKKDPEFFQTAVFPYLKNKKDKQFIDRWLLGDELSAYVQPWQYAQLNVVERILLSQRLADDRPHTIRDVQDRFALIPPDVERANFLFDTAVKGSALETGDKLGIEAAKKVVARVEVKQLENLGALVARGAAPARSGRPAAAEPPPAPSAAAEAAAPALAMREMAETRAAARDKAEQAGADRRMRILKRKSADGKPDEAALFFARDAELRKSVRQLYQQVDKTQEWAENNYYHLTIDRQNADLVTVNAFWRDYAAHDPAQGGAFRSVHLAEASRNFPEMMFALAVLDLPFKASEHATKFNQAEMTFTAGSPLIAFHEEIKETEPLKDAAPILVSQNFFRHSDRYRFENNEKLDKFVTEEFLVGVVYGCQIVVTNPTSSPQKLDVLLQVPTGAIPVLNGQSTRSVHIDLQPYATQTLEYHFYFPAAGKYPHYPVHVAKNERLLAQAAPFTLNVVDKLSRVDTESWDYVSQQGTSEDVLRYLQQQNLHRVKLDRIAFRMQDKAFFDQAIPLLARRHLYDQTLWSYAVKHNEPAAIAEFLQHADDFVNQCGAYLASPLLRIDPVLRKSYEHLDYKPLVNARAHQLGQRRQILNDRFHAQYHRLLRVLSYRRQLDDAEMMAVVYYLLLQDRVQEAADLFARVNPANLATRLQHDYFAAYLAMSREKPEQAKTIAAKYADYPVDRWREAFAAVTAQVAEITGAGAQVVDAEDRGQQQTQLAATEPSFDFQVEAKAVKINYQNLAAIRVHYYLMDIELLFSRNPFVQQYSGQFSHIRPNATQAVELPKGQTVHTFELPKELLNRNVLVEITGGSQTKSQAYYSNSLAVQVIENYGQVRVTHSGTNQPLPKVYVKVYARMQDGSVRFFKDGYTDLRGRFEYASLSTNELDFAQKFSLLILSDEHGAVVREASPPKR